MTPEDRKELEQILSVAAPVLGQLMNKAVLAALRQHSSEQVVTAVQGQTMQFADMRTDPISKPIDEQILNLVGEFDAAKWAKEFKRLFPNTDEGLMLGWFANAIMAGYDYMAKEERKKLKSMQDCLDIQGSNGNWDSDHYMHGMFNGMEHMMAIMEDRDPQFRGAPAKWLNDKIAQQSKPISGTRESTGERVVWAQAYATMLPQCGVGSSDAAKLADRAVELFRERYK